MKRVSLMLAAALALAGCGPAPAARPHGDSKALGQAAPERLAARYVITPRGFEAAGPQALPEKLEKRLRAAGFLEAGGARDWCPATRKAAFFSSGWVWITGEDAASSKSVWFEPDLKAKGELQWNADGTQLRLRADGWRHGLVLELEIEGDSVENAGP